MRSGADLEIQVAEGIPCRQRATHRTPRTVKRRVEAVPRGVLLYAPMPRELFAHERVVALEEVAPAVISDLGSLGRPVHDVSEERGREEAVAIRDCARAGKELLDLADDLVLVRYPPHVIAAREFDVLDVGNVLSEVPPVPHIDVAVIGCLDDQGRHADLGERRANVHIGVHPQQLRCRGR